ncbi:hypothetical protein [Niabella beijingensis]|uniref:hypothetical protein n=1 Tax=Niabella beijingensis TaxID=2872700 RepID=UPI001CBEF02B|nr:hypothetical protein [Niabella beijingensis]MBZ4189823.1 hypothetical protein [Niabella beijingensis]
MRFLPFVSLLLFLAGCAPVAYKQLQKSEGDVHCIERYRPQIRRALYRTSVDVAGNHLSGILLVKQMPDSTTRIVFTNEAGFTFFDFEFTAGGGFRVHSIISKMDKEAVRKTLRKDFELVLMNRLNAATATVFKKQEEYYYTFRNGKDRYYYITDAGCTRLLRMERGDTKKKVVEATSGVLQGGVPETVVIRHSNFNFTIELKRIYDNAEE